MSSRQSSAQWRPRPAGKRTIFVSDTAFEPAVIGIIDKMVRALPFSRSEYDTDSSSVPHLKYEWTLQDVEAHPLLHRVGNVIGGAVNQLYADHSPVLQRVHVNDHPFGDLQSAHQDLVPGVTAILYVNSEWRDEWEGETLFYEDGEAVAAVAPRPGRVAIFGGDIVHRGGTPARVCPHSRYTIALKYSTAAIVP